MHTAASISGMQDSDDDTDDEYPPTSHILFPNYKRKTAKERFLAKNNNGALDDNSSDASGTPGSYGKRIEFFGYSAQNFC